MLKSIDTNGKSYVIVAKYRKFDDLATALDIIFPYCKLTTRGEIYDQDGKTTKFAVKKLRFRHCLIYEA